MIEPARVGEEARRLSLYSLLLSLSTGCLGWGRGYGGIFLGGVLEPFIHEGFEACSILLVPPLTTVK